ncbi:MAG: Tol-Pal system beta propeller repeat protein TolB [Gammaproteobacteria bacterium]|nr:Tol-Pal system beta propeller repeat protein TolB [Gammaproteobacteria bacterium]
MMKKLFYTTITMLLLLPSLALALDLELTQGLGQPSPIAIAPFAGQTNQINTIIGNDLNHSGLFAVMATDKLPQQPTQLSNVAFGDWRKVNINNLLIGNITPAPKQKLRVGYLLLDTFKSRQLLHFRSVAEARVNPSLDPVLIYERYIIAANGERALAHHIADRVFYKLTDIRGAFSTSIAYIAVQRQAGKPTRYQLVIADVDGQHPQPLLTSTAPIMSPAWSADGKKIAYVSFEDHKMAIYISTLATGKRQLIKRFTGINSAPAWSPDGHWLAVALSKAADQSDHPDIYLLNLKNNHWQQLTHSDSIDTEPAWSTDGHSLLFTSNREGSAQIYVMNLTNKTVKRLTNNGDYNARAAFTPDGKSIVFLHRSTEGFTIAIKNLANGDLRLLTPAGTLGSPSIAPNGQQVIYEIDNGDSETLATVSINGRVNRTFAKTAWNRQSPTWGPFTSSAS